MLPDTAGSNPRKKTMKEWHITLGHLNLKDLREAIKNNTIQGLDVDNPNEELDCETCLRNKMVRPPFPNESNRKT